MKRLMCWGVTFALMVGGMGMWPQAARAQEHRGWYLNGGVGINHLDIYGNEDLGAGLGVRAVAGLGYRIDPHWALELDTGFIHNPFPGGEESLNQIPFVVGGAFSLHNESKFEPFVGLGMGGTVVRIAGETGTDFILGFKGGVRRELNERAAIGIDYTYFMFGLVSLILGEPAGDDTVNLTIRWKL